MIALIGTDCLGFPRCGVVPTLDKDFEQAIIRANAWMCLSSSVLNCNYTLEPFYDSR